MRYSFHEAPAGKLFVHCEPLCDAFREGNLAKHNDAASAETVTLVHPSLGLLFFFLNVYFRKYLVDADGGLDGETVTSGE